MNKLRGLLILVVIVVVVYAAYSTYQKNHAGELYNIDLEKYKVGMEGSIPGVILNFTEENGQYKYLVTFNTETTKNMLFETPLIDDKMQTQEKLEMYVKSDTDYICVHAGKIIYASDEAVQNHKKSWMS